MLKNCSYTGIAVSPDSRNIFAVGSDRKIKEIGDSQVIYSFYSLLFPVHKIKYE